MLMLLHRDTRICILQRHNPQRIYGLWRTVQSHAENLLQDHIEVPGLLPSHEITSKPSYVHWGRRSDGVEIMLNTSSIDTAYNEITTWRKNTFLVPHGKTGRDFIEQLTKHINDWNNKTEMQHSSEGSYCSTGTRPTKTKLTI